MIASRSCFRFSDPVPPHPKGALLDWDLVTVEAIWIKWTHCHVQEISLSWFELWHGALSCWKYSSEDGYTVVIKGWTWSATILRYAVAFKRCSIGTKLSVFVYAAAMFSVMCCSYNISKPEQYCMQLLYVMHAIAISDVYCSLCSVWSVICGRDLPQWSCCNYIYKRVLLSSLLC